MCAFFNFRLLSRPRQALCKDWGVRAAGCNFPDWSSPSSAASFCNLRCYIVDVTPRVRVMWQMKLLPCTSSYDGTKCLHNCHTGFNVYVKHRRPNYSTGKFQQTPRFHTEYWKLWTWQQGRTACDVIRLNNASLYSLLGLLVMLTLRASKQDFECVAFTVHPTRARTLTNKPLCTSQRSNVCVPNKAFRPVSHPKVQTKSQVSVTFCVIDQVKF